MGTHWRGPSSRGGCWRRIGEVHAVVDAVITIIIMDLVGFVGSKGSGMIAIESARVLSLNWVATACYSIPYRADGAAHFTA